MSVGVTYRTGLGAVDWGRMKALLAGDDFDNGRTPAELRRSFENSYATVVAYVDELLAGGATRERP